VTFFVISGHRQAQRIRAAYFRSLLCQEIGWYDQNLAGALSTRIAGDIPKIQEAIGDKVSKWLARYAHAGRQGRASGSLSPRGSPCHLFASLLWSDR
jgi:hypothetical protein